MAREDKANRCRAVYAVWGAKLLEKMTERNWTEAKLAEKARVSEQTVRNYLSSDETNPWIASANTFARMCLALGVSPGELTIQVLAPDPLDSDSQLVAEMRFATDAPNTRSIEGTWNVTSDVVEIPDFITYGLPSRWRAVFRVTQKGNQFESEGEDQDGDLVYAVGSLMEGGNWLRFNYWLDNARLRVYGAAMVEYKGDGNTMEGIAVGRDGPHQSSRGLIASHIRFTRD